MADLTNSIKGDIVTPDHPDYSPSLSRWAKNTERKARMVVFVKDAVDVVTALSYAKNNKLPIAVRGGGVNPAGASSVQDGLVIDLSRHLNQVRVDPQSRLAYVGGGAIWKDVDAETIKHGLATVGPTVNHTGVGGFTLGGGYGWLTGRHGLSIDNLKQVTVVTANGSILTASDTDNQDLFWAIRGGGRHLGVITDFVYQLHSQRKTVFGGRIVFTPDKVERLIELTKSWYSTVKEDEGMIQIVSVSPAGQPVLVANLFYNGSEDEGRANFKDFFDIGPVKDDSKEIPYEQLNALMNDRIDHGHSYLVRAISQKVRDHPSTMKTLQKTGEITQGGQYTPFVLFEYIPFSKANSTAASATALPRPLTPNTVVLLKWSGDSPDKAVEAKGLMNEYLSILTRVPGAGQVEKSDDRDDLNVPAEHFPHPTLDHIATSPQVTFASNYPRLHALKKTHDSEGIFDILNQWLPIQDTDA